MDKEGGSREPRPTKTIYKVKTINNKIFKNKNLNKLNKNKNNKSFNNKINLTYKI